MRRRASTVFSRCEVEDVPANAIEIYEVLEINSTCSMCDLSLPPLCTLHLCTSEMVRVVDW